MLHSGGKNNEAKRSLHDARRSAGSKENVKRSNTQLSQKNMPNTKAGERTVVLPSEATLQPSQSSPELIRQRQYLQRDQRPGSLKEVKPLDEKRMSQFEATSDQIKCGKVSLQRSRKNF